MIDDQNNATAILIGIVCVSIATAYLYGSQPVGWLVFGGCFIFFGTFFSLFNLWYNTRKKKK
jgi:1,4-dihydroxy-2-naphthoate octaprenyltransferase